MGRFELLFKAKEEAKITETKSKKDNNYLAPKYGYRSPDRET